MLDLAGAVSLVAAAMLAAQSVTREGDWATGVFLAVAAAMSLQHALGTALLLGPAREGALLVGLALASAGRPHGLRSLTWLVLPALLSGRAILALPLLGVWLAARKELRFEDRSPFARFHAVYRDRVAVMATVASTAQRDLVLARAFAGLPVALRNYFAAGFLAPWPLHWLGEFLVFYCVSEWLPPVFTEIGLGLVYLRIATV
jgi:hypothetical protein